mgnify:FL=1|jgi:hypothetical protein|tara:strand:+ start:3457 stop:3957 length:501 start_codon:yes stop_codon:yes gene_type:complete
MINSYNLFAVPMTHGRMPIPINIHKKVLKFVEENYKPEDNISCIKGFQYHDAFNGKKELDDFINNYLGNVHNLKIKYSWLNVLDNESYNTPHSHVGDHVTHAGVLYLSNTNNNIHFARDNDTFEIKPKLFDYLVFPFNLLHYVLPEKRFEKRICYAFNLTDVTNVI